MVVTGSRSSKGEINMITAPKFQGFNTTSNILYGLNEEEMGLPIEGRKRVRTEDQEVVQRNMEMGFRATDMITDIVTEGATISTGDLVVTTNNDMAELARQASQQQ